VRIYILVACALFSISCSSKKLVVRDTVTRVENPPKVINDNKLVNTSSANDYILRFRDIAMSEMNRNGIPASITLAQGLLESANGNSSLAREANNHFGIKCNTDWKGPSVLKDDDAAGECFRMYKDPEESYKDHSEFLKRARYAFLFQLDRNDYQGWARGLKQAGYATNPKYAELLITLIERYDLTQYDRGEVNLLAKEKREEKIQNEIVREQPRIAEQPQKAAVEMKIYEVKQGDTLYSIGKRYGLTVEEIRALNSIQGTDLKLGQLLLVSK
jgi:flagellum-specific peptidoglycan hydrolase FlgJ